MRRGEVHRDCAEARLSFRSGCQRKRTMRAIGGCVNNRYAGSYREETNEDGSNSLLRPLIKDAGGHRCSCRAPSSRRAESPSFSLERPPETMYARSGDVNIAYQVIGDAPLDLVFVMGWVSHLEYFWREPSFARFFATRIILSTDSVRQTRNRALRSRSDQ